MRVARRFLISGRVQGVGYRYFAQDAARRENITGLVRNLDDGRVEAIAEGEAEAMERFELALHRGPSHARVADVHSEPIVPTGRYVGFMVG